MPHSALFRLLVVAGAAVASIAAGAAVAPAAHADDHRPTPPGLSSPPSAAVLHAVPLTKPHGRKLR